MTNTNINENLLPWNIETNNIDSITSELDNIVIFHSNTMKKKNRVIPPIMKLKLEDITVKRALIRTYCRDRYPMVTTQLITQLLWYYDSIFLHNFLSVDFKALKYHLTIKIEFLPNGYAGCITFKDKNFTLSINSDYAKIVPFGKKCKSGYDRLGHIMRTLEHEIVHILHLTHPNSDKSQDHHGEWFNIVSKNLFNHDYYRD